MAVFYFYGRFQFGWDTSTFGAFLIVLIFANAFGNTVMVNAFAKCIKNQWKTASICAFFIFLQFVAFAFAPTPFASVSDMITWR